jgi:hypothetical protein
MTHARWSFFVVAFLGALLAAAPPADAAPRRRKPSSTQAPTPKAPPKPSETVVSPSDGPGARRGPARIEFDDRLVQGQTNKANAIYLFERRESALRSLVKKRVNFQAEIDEMLDAELVR